MLQSASHREYFEFKFVIILKIFQTATHPRYNFRLNIQGHFRILSNCIGLICNIIIYIIPVCQRGQRLPG